MTPDERDRLVKAEAMVEALHDDLHEIKKDLKTLLAAYNQGRGALWLMMAASGLFGGAVSYVVSHVGK